MKFDSRFVYFITTIIFILTLASVGTPYNSSRVNNTMYLYSTIGIFISGLLFFIGGKKDVRDTLNTGFGIGIPSWIVSIVASTMGMHWNHINLLQIDFKIKYMLLKYGLTFYIWVDLFFGRAIFGYNIGFYGALAQVFLSVSILILGALAFFLTNLNHWKLMREKVIFGFCPYCGLNLRGRYGITHCPNCRNPING